MSLCRWFENTFVRKEDGNEKGEVPQNSNKNWKTKEWKLCKQSTENKGHCKNNENIWGTNIFIISKKRIKGQISIGYKREREKLNVYVTLVQYFHQFIVYNIINW